MPLPNILEFIGNNVTQAGFKAAQEKLLNFLSGEAATKVELSAAVTPKADKTYVDSALSSFQNGAIKTYPTLSAANADIANIALNTKVSVLSAEDGGDYYKAASDATSLTKSAYDPLAQAKADATVKAEAAKNDAITAAATDASDKANAAENNAINYINLKLVNFGPRSGYLGGYVTDSGLMLLGFRTSDGRPIFGNGGDFITELETQKSKFDQSIEVVSANPRSGILGGIKTPSGMLLISFDAKTGKPILAGVDVIQEIENLKNSSNNNAAELQLFPDDAFAAWGDSLTATGSSGNWLQKLSDEIGYQYYNGGIGGQGSRQIAARQGGVPVRFDAFTIPANTSAVSVTVSNGFSPCTKGGSAQAIIISGIYGSLQQDSDGNHTFTRSNAGEAKNIAKGTAGYSVLGEQYSKRIQFIGTGRNSFKTMSANEILDIVKSMTDYQRTQIKRFVIWSFPYWPGESTAFKAKIDEVNGLLEKTFPYYFVDIRKWLCTTSPQVVGSTTINDPWTVLGITPTAQDLADAAEGLTPISFRSAANDGHFNSLCGTAIAYRMKMNLLMKGWI